MDQASSKLRELWRFAAAREFVVGRDELLEHGFGRHQIRSWLRTGRLLRVLQSVYSYGRDVDSSNAVWRAALLAAGPGSALTGLSACQKWGFVEMRQTIPATIEVAAATGKARSFMGVSPATRNTRVNVTRRQYNESDLRAKDGVALLSPVLALIDLAGSATDREIRFAFLEACRLGLFRDADVSISFEMMVGRRGARRLRPLLGLWRPELNRIRSVFEGLFLLAWIERGYPMPLVNVKVHGKEVDCFWPGKGFVLELDGGTYHRYPAQLNIDLGKQAMLEAQGLTVARLTFGRFEADPWREVDRVAAMLGFTEAPSKG